MPRLVRCYCKSFPRNLPSHPIESIQMKGAELPVHLRDQNVAGPIWEAMTAGGICNGKGLGGAASGHRTAGITVPQWQLGQLDQ